MFKLVLAVALVGFAAAASVDSDVHAEVKLLKSEILPDGNYAYAYETSNGISAQEAGNEQGAHGDFGFITPDGQSFKVTYVADENGFQPQGAHLPQIPEAILRSLEYIRAHPSAEANAYNQNRKL